MSAPVRIPADVDLPDRVIGPLTARQVAILAVTGLVLYATWTLTRAVVPVAVFVAVAIPFGASAAVLALGQREGISLDRMLLAAIRQRITPRHRVAAPEAVHPAPAWLSAQASAASAGRAGRTRPGAAGEARSCSSALRLPARRSLMLGSSTWAVTVWPWSRWPRRSTSRCGPRPSNRAWSPASGTTCIP